MRLTVNGTSQMSARAHRRGRGRIDVEVPPVKDCVRDALPYARAVAEIRPADPSHIARVAEVLGRAFVTEPMMTWPLGGRSDDLEERCIRAYALFLGPLLDEGLVWETADGHGALVLVSPDQTDVWDDAVAHVDHSATHDVTG